MQDFHQVADALFPDIKSVLSSRSGAHVLPIPRETALLPHGSTNRYTETVISVLRLPSPQQLFLKTKNNKMSRDRQKYLNLLFATIYYKTQSNRDVETADWKKAYIIVTHNQAWLTVAEKCCLKGFANKKNPGRKHSAQFFTYLLTRSWSFWMGSGSPSFPQAFTSSELYTLITLSAVFTRKQLQQGNMILYRTVILKFNVSGGSYFKAKFSGLYHHHHLVVVRNYIAFREFQKTPPVNKCFNLLI